MTKARILLVAAAAAVVAAGAVVAVLLGHGTTSHSPVAARTPAMPAGSGKRP